MKKTVLFLVFTVLCYIGCRNSGPPKIINTAKLSSSNTLSESNSDFNNSLLLKKIDSFILIIDSISPDEKFQNVVIVKFRQSNDSLLMSLETNYYYYLDFDYYFLRDSLMVAFYNTYLWPDKYILNDISFIAIPNEFKSEREASITPYEAITEEFLYINQDSIVPIEFKY